VNHRASCVFCRIVDRTEAGSVVADEKDAVAFLDVQPVNDGHTLVVPRKHFAALADLDELSAVAIWSLARRIAAAIRRSDVRCEGIDLLIADGEVAGQEVFHTHLHVIPRWNGDGFGFHFPEHYRDRQPRERLDDVGGRIRRAL
jgi:histidine triad (HIT) family protein